MPSAQALRRRNLFSAVHRRLVEREWGLARGNWPSLRSDIVQWAEGVTSDLRATGTEAALGPPLRKAIAWHVYVAARAKGRRLPLALTLPVIHALGTRIALGS